MARTKSFIAIPLAAVVLSASLSFGAGADSDALAKMEYYKSQAYSYESSGNITFAEMALENYASIASELAESGLVSRSEAELAAAHRDILRFDPHIYVKDSSANRKVFAGSDGYYSENASAVKLCVPYDTANTEDFYHLIPNTSKELCVLVTFELSSESSMRKIGFGKDDAKLIENLRQLSLIKGRVHLAFCPNVNSMRRTRTLAKSYISAYRHTAELARRYAPNVQLVYSVGDVLIPGEDTLSLFYPGDEYVDVLGIELCHTYSKSYMPSSEAAYDRRGEYYDPVYSVKRMTDEFYRLCGREDIPVMVTGCSFPWDGKAQVSDYAEQMERFWRLIPLVCPSLTAVFYSNASSSFGICNLRQNDDARRLYEECLTLPPYNGSLFIPLENSTEFDKDTRLELYCGGKFSEEFEVWLNGEPVSADTELLSAGSLTVYMTGQTNPAKLEYTLTLSDGDRLIATQIVPEYDFNKNGYLDFGDVGMILAHIAGWDIGADGENFDINGDGRVNLSDSNALKIMLAPGN